MNKTLFIFSLLISSLSYAADATSLNLEKAPFQLPKLDYKTSALAPAIDEQTMQIHHGKHHQSYVDKLNAALSETERQKSLIEILRSIKNYSFAVRNNAGGHWNHSFFWMILTPDSKKTKISTKLESQIKKDFGSLDKFKEQFENQALNLFGSGWVWLIVGTDGKLQITTTPNQDNPLMDVVAPQGKPILGLDVWEHAYYLQYQNKRADYTKAFWNIVNWDQVSMNFAKGK